jgi:putative ABC transport system permease protein
MLSELWTFHFLETLWQDLRYGLGQFRRNPGFTIVAVLTLALGIGAMTVMFSVVEGAVLNPFPYADSHRLAVVVIRYEAYGPDYYWGWYPVQEFREFRKQVRSLDQMIGLRHDQFVLTGSDVPLALDGVKTTGNTFQMLGMPPLMGRTFTPADAEPGAPPVVVLRHKAWQSKFGGDPGIVGRTLVLNGQPTTVIGVMPPRFSLGGGEMWLPENFAGGKPGEEEWDVSTVGHLKPGVSVEQAAAEVAVLFKGYAEHYPKLHPKRTSFSAELLANAAVGRAPHRIFYILLGAVGLLLVIACLNVANLLLARANARETEIAIRASLGAGRLRLLRQFMVESLLLAAGGAFLGCLFAWVGLKAAMAIIPWWEMPTEAAIRINGPVLLFAIALALASTLLFGLAPALHSLRRDLQGDLRSGRQGTGDSRGKSRLRNVLVVSEVALSLMLLTGAGVLMRSFFAIRNVNLGYDPANVLLSRIRLPGFRYKTAEKRNLFSTELLSRLRAMPGVGSAALAVPPPVWPGMDMGIEIPGRPSQEKQRAQLRLTSDGFTETLRIPLLNGRSISEEDFKLARKVALINQTFARRHFSGQNPLGRQVSMQEMGNPPFSVKSPTFEIVGITGDIQDNGPGEPSQPAIYIPYTVAGTPLTFCLLRTAAAPELLLNPLRREVASIDSELPLEGQSLESILDENWFTEPRFVATLMSVFAALGLALVLIGVYSVLSYAVTRRTHEIGIRMAMGAEAGDVRRMVMLWGLRWLAIGIGIGVPASIGLAKVLQNRIWGLKSADPLTLVAVSLALIAVGLASCYIPARRATKVEPMVALRYE